MIRIDITSPHVELPIQRARVREIVQKTLEGENITNAKISVAFVDNATIQRLNKRYLNHDEPTDVLAFPWSGPSDSALEGELVISAEIAKDQAKALGHDVQAELALYVIHGILHLCGYDDKEPGKSKEMRQRERHHLSLSGLPDIAPVES
jgi:probable rRNA maturation factor